MSVDTSTAVPAPFSLEPAWSWSGDDGSWSTFQIAVGTPPQPFNILPSTTGAEVWIPIPEGCEGILVNIQNCGILRGVDDFNGETSRGFQTNESSTWDLLGIYNLATEQNLWGPTGNPGQYGLDTVSFGTTQGGQDIELEGQAIAGVATANVWLGSLGLGTASLNFDVHPEDILSPLSSLRNANYTPSLSFGYTAGASYSTPQDYGSLIFGGYDEARFTSSNFNYSIAGTDRKTLPLSLASIIAENAFGGTVSLLPNGDAVTTIIDSTVAQMWLPQNVCDLFAQAFGLTYDTLTGLYVVNNTIHQELTQMNPSVTFTVAGTGDSSSTTNIELPYAAFDLKAGIPIFNTSTNYFPLRVSANESQQVLGRAFLQEAYIFVDWERDYFTIGQVKHQNSTSNIVPVLSPSYDMGSGGESSGLSTGAIAGIAVGACVLIGLLIALIAFFVVRSRRKRRAAQEDEDHLPNELHSEHVKPPEIMSAQVYEMQEGENSRHELYANDKNVQELQGESFERELEGDLGKNGWDKKPNTYYELP
jgi:hypothetical protein